MVKKPLIKLDEPAVPFEIDYDRAIVSLEASRGYWSVIEDAILAYAKLSDVFYRKGQL